MPRLTASPDDLTAVGALTSGDADVLAGAAASVEAAGRLTQESIGPAASVLAAADVYVRVDAAVAGALGEAVRLLGQALAEAGAAYREVEATVDDRFGRRRP